MASPRLIYTAATGQYHVFIEELHKRIATAATGAMKEAAEKLKLEARANIRAAGFSKRWENAFRVNVYPDRGRTVSTHAAALAFHKIPYANIFETGGTISGSPLLWLPLPNVPTSIPGTRGGRVHMSPAAYVRSIGPLHAIYRPGKPPLLAAYLPAGAAITVRNLKIGARGGKTRPGAPSKRLVSVPLFFGISSVSLKKRFNLTPLFTKAQASLGELYLKNFK